MLLAGSYGTLTLTPYGVTELAPLTLTLPEAREPVRLWGEVREPTGTLRARSSLDLGVF